MEGVHRLNAGASAVRSTASLRTHRAELSTGPVQEDALERARGLVDGRSVAAAPSESVGVNSFDARPTRVEAAPAPVRPLNLATLNLARDASERSTCDANAEDDNSDASTTASVSEPPPESPRVRWADVEDSEEEEEVEAIGSSSLPAPAWAAPTEPARAKVRWADIVDSEEEEQGTPGASSAQPALQRGGSMPSERPSKPAAVVGRSTIVRGRTDHPAQAPAPTASAAGSRGEAAAAAVSEHRGEGRAVTAWAQGGAARQAAAGSRGQWHQAGSHRSSAKGGAGWGQAGRHGKMAAQGKRQCQFMIGIEEEPHFQVKQKILGRHGQHMKSIAEKTGAKLRLRGRGSGFLEGPEQQESSDPLMLCVSAPNAWAYQEAKRLVRELLEGVHVAYGGFCTQAGRATPDLSIQVHEGPRPGSF
mmetsp:Transcript_77462/g.205640  ORF Transcript_77462/g.205640 Transcript_77462/m.205640 type:complete len:419 (-) Transcript_77462:119-1375(-)|eukprot:CAMPEP_0171175580 /NCGR_PEP_ID=MMETSP0790-20130122/11300_1 /TAXON_ID=2925 /ORGANISM="Alexandrium catenella, Strain OF101" /LENGTH=418 /DNA_ID=CAMNT_0011640457 /DNA_START=60 /DNA_END=1316 /DNA_ORIENTATION=-